MPSKAVRYLFSLFRCGSLCSNWPKWIAGLGSPSSRASTVAPAVHSTLPGAIAAGESGPPIVRRPGRRDGKPAPTCLPAGGPARTQRAFFQGSGGRDSQATVRGGELPLPYQLPEIVAKGAEQPHLPGANQAGVRELPSRSTRVQTDCVSRGCRRLLRPAYAIKNTAETCACACACRHG